MCEEGHKKLPSTVIIRQKPSLGNGNVYITKQTFVHFQIVYVFGNDIQNICEQV